MSRWEAETVVHVGDLQRYIDAIRRSGTTIYDIVARNLDELWIPTDHLERLLDLSLRGTSLGNLPLRTRSKVVKEHICRALGYPVPRTFKRTQPRFPSQDFDVYVQKSNNIQIWNEDLQAARRYVVVRVSRLDEDETITQVRVVSGQHLAGLDTTRTITRKYQARMLRSHASTEWVTETDTVPLTHLVADQADLVDVHPTALPRVGELLSIKAVFERLRPLVGAYLTDPGRDQERNRGALLHRLVCQRLGYSVYGDDGRFPDIRHQLLEVKLQTSTTIDLGLVDPHSPDPLDIPHIGNVQIRHCDIRFAVFGGTIADGDVALTSLCVVTGEMFFARFAQFQGLVLNRKFQIHLPPTFFDDPR